MSNLELPVAAGILVAAVVLQLVYLSVYARRAAFFAHPTGDSAVYLELAGRLLSGAGPSSFYRAPGYQYLLALMLKLGGGRLVWVYLCQALMNAATLVLVYAMARPLAGRIAAAVALALAGLAGPLWPPPNRSCASPPATRWQSGSRGKRGAGSTAARAASRRRGSACRLLNPARGRSR
jgi:hypothetical protein